MAENQPGEKHQRGKAAGPQQEGERPGLLPAPQEGAPHHEQKHGDLPQINVKDLEEGGGKPGGGHRQQGDPGQVGRADDGRSSCQAGDGPPRRGRVRQHEGGVEEQGVERRAFRDDADGAPPNAKEGSLHRGWYPRERERPPNLNGGSGADGAQKRLHPKRHQQEQGAQKREPQVW